MGRFLVVLEGLGGSFGGLGGSRAALGRLLGGLGAVLDRSWVVLGRHGSFRVILESASCCEPRHFDAQRGAKMSQNRTQDGPKSKTKTKTKKDALEDRLGAVLGRFWVVLGAVLEGKNRLKPYAFLAVS